MNGSGCEQSCLNLPFSEAHAHCASVGKRLCTEDEIIDGQCCSTECEEKVFERSWTSSHCQHDTPDLQNDLFSVDGYGRGVRVGEADDSFHFVELEIDPIGHDFYISLELEDLLNADMDSQAGLMIRETLEPDSPYWFIYVTGDGTFEAEYRAMSAQPSEQCELSPDRRHDVEHLDGVVLKIEKKGSTTTLS